MRLRPLKRSAMRPVTPISRQLAPLPAAAGLGLIVAAGVDRAKELAAFARAGFSREAAQAVLTCADPDEAETLAKGEAG